MRDTKSTQHLNNPVDKRVTFISWNDISEPGLYVDTQYPRFFRVTEEGITPGASPNIHGSEFTVARISSDPLLLKARVQQICADSNLPVPE